MREFVLSLDPKRFTLNFSLDGTEKSHDAHRKFRGGKHAGSTFDAAIANFSAYPRRDLVRVIMTIAPSEAGTKSAIERTPTISFSRAAWNKTSLESLNCNIREGTGFTENAVATDPGK